MSDTGDPDVKGGYLQPKLTRRQHEVMTDELVDRNLGGGMYVYGHVRTVHALLAAGLLEHARMTGNGYTHRVGLLSPEGVAYRRQFVPQEVDDAWRP